MRWLLAVALLTSVGCAARPSSATSLSPPRSQLGTIPVHLHIGTNRRGPVVDPDTLGEWLGQAAMDFSRAGFSLEVASVRYVDAPSIDVRTSRGRTGLSELGDAAGLHVAVAGPLRRPRRHRPVRGTWMPRQGVIVLSTEASRSTLSHEIGHALGLSHEAAQHNLMCSCERTAQAEFSAGQRASMSETVARRWGTR